MPSCVILKLRILRVCLDVCAGSWIPVDLDPSLESQPFWPDHDGSYLCKRLVNPHLPREWHRSVTAVDCIICL